MRCITAIWPAGPPKLSAATRNHTRNASPNETPCPGVARAMVPPTSRLSHLLPLKRPPAASNYGFRPEGPAPGVERVVHHHAVREHGVVVREIGRKPERKREQAGRLWGQLEPRRIGAAHDQRQRVERMVLDAVDLEKRVEAAELALVRERLGAGDVIRRWRRFATRRQKLVRSGRTGIRLPDR